MTGVATAPAGRARRRRRPPPDVPRLAEGVELVGEYEDSGFKEPQFIARRADGQVIQLSELLNIVAEQVDGRRDFGRIAERASERFGRTVSAGNVQFLVEKQLRPLGVLAAADGSSPKLPKADPLLALKFRTALIPAGVVRAITTVCRPLFWPPVLVAALAGLVALDVWVFFVHGVGQSARQLVYQPALLILIFGLIALATFFHECGHATACRYGGAKPGVMGAGIYIVWPAFYTDVTDAYRLDRTGRLRTDLGGIYFNGVFCLLTGGAYALTRFEPLLIVIALQHLQMLQQLLPFLRLDGYYVISDLTGVPDIFRRIKPVLRSMLPSREADPMVDELKPWVQKVVTVYVLALVPAFAALFTVLALSAPRMLATAYDSFFVQLDKVTDALSEGAGLSLAAGSLQLVSLVLPSIGLTLTSGRVARRLGAGAWRFTDGRPRLRGGLAAGTAAAGALLAFLWWPNGEYRPIQPGEKGTLAGAVTSIAEAPGGRPALTPERERALGGAPTVREQGGDFRRVRGLERQRSVSAPEERGRERRTREGDRGEEAPSGGALPLDPGAPEDAVPAPGETAPAPSPRPAPPPAETVPGATTTAPAPTTTTP